MKCEARSVSASAAVGCFQVTETCCKGSDITWKARHIPFPQQNVIAAYINFHAKNAL
jgi:hypothetical protein